MEVVAGGLRRHYPDIVRLYPAIGPTGFVPSLVRLAFMLKPGKQRSHYANQRGDVSYLIRAMKLTLPVLLGDV